MTTTQKNFSPMRGHVFNGCKVACDNGDILTITNTLKGWKLTNKAGLQVGQCTHDSSLVTLYVIGYGQ